VSKDKGYDPLIKHLRATDIDVRRHDSFATVSFSAPAAARKVKSDSKVKSDLKPKTPGPISDARESRVLKHLLTRPNNRPKRKAALLRLLLTQFGSGINNADALGIITNLERAGHLSIDVKGAVRYFFPARLSDKHAK
jgi:hypothetical protein